MYGVARACWARGESSVGFVAVTTPFPPFLACSVGSVDIDSQSSDSEVEGCVMRVVGPVTIWGGDSEGAEAR